MSKLSPRRMSSIGRVSEQNPAAHRDRTSHRFGRLPRAIGLGVLATAVVAGGTSLSTVANAGPGQQSAGLEAPEVHSAHDLSAPQIRAPKPHSSAGEAHGTSGDSSDAGQSKAGIPGVGDGNLGKLPDDTKQVIVASAPKQSGSSNTVSFYQRRGDAWKKLRSFHGHNGKKGFTIKHKEGDLRTPSGVYSLTDAGGYLKNPGSKLPYSHDTSMNSAAASAYGDDYKNVFDYVIAINYNRKAGKPPADSTRPDGWGKGGGIWLHLDHDSGTHGCVTLDRNDLRWVLRHLDPHAKPHIIMGSAADVAK